MHHEFFNDKDPVTYKLILINTLHKEIPQITSSLFSLPQKGQNPILHTYNKLICYQGTDIALNINELDLSSQSFGDLDRELCDRVLGIILLYNSKENEEYNKGLQAYNHLKYHLASKNLQNYAIEIKEPGHHGKIKKNLELRSLRFEIMESHDLKIDVFEKIGIDLFRKIELRSASSDREKNHLKMKIRGAFAVITLLFLAIYFRRYMWSSEKILNRIKLE